MSFPNAVSLARLFTAPLVVWLILTGEMAFAFWVFLAASVSDAVDGFIAKRFERSTVLGGYLDPLADKALLVSVYVVLGAEGYLDLWLVILVVFRDIVIVGGALLFRLLTGTLAMQPLMVSKVNTVTQIVLAATVLGHLGLEIELAGVIVVLVYVVAVTTVVSGGAYLVDWTRQAARVESPE